MKMRISFLSMTDEEAVAYILSHPVSGGKGDTTATSTEKSEGSFTNTLQQVFATNNAKQQANLDFLTKQLQEGVTNPQGYSPETLASMRTQATESAAENNQKVLQAVQENNALKGGASATALPNGVQAQIQAGVANQEAENEANAQLGITEKQGEMQQEEKQRDIAALEGVASEENPEGMASGANTAASDVGGLSQAVTQANGPGWGSILGGVVGAGLGVAGSYYGAKK